VVLQRDFGTKPLASSGFAKSSDRLISLYEILPDHRAVIKLAIPYAFFSSNLQPLSALVTRLFRCQGTASDLFLAYPLLSEALIFVPLLKLDLMNPFQPENSV
jgi:hypothetical protein